MKKYAFYILFSCFLSGLVSCAENIDYRFQVVNKTDYELGSVLVDWCHSDNKIAVQSNGVSDPFTLTYRTSWANFFGPGSLCVTVLSYSDTVKTYENTVGGGTDRNRLKEGQLNIITLTEDPNPFYETNKFIIKVE